MSQDSKYRVNQPIINKTNRHINTYRVYGSIISTNIHKPGRCTFLCYNSILFLAKLLQHLGPFRCVPLMVHLYYYYCWMHIHPDCHICRSGTAIKIKCLWVLSINTDLCSNKITNKKTIITWSLKQMVWLITWTNNTKVIQRWKEHFTYDLPSGNLISFFPSGP